MKRIISIIISITMFFSITAAASEIPAMYDISDYINNEVFVIYHDGSFDVLKYESTEELKAGIIEISQNKEVTLYQPNYSYSASALNVNDQHAEKQWALYNDGSFRMETQRNDFPVFDTPFGEVRMPGEWLAPDYFGTPGGNYRWHSYYGQSVSVTAKEGIDINMESANSLYTDSGKEVIVALVDTGIDYTHEDLSGNIWTNTDEIAGNGIDDDGNGYTDDVYGWNFYDNSNQLYRSSEDDHGTHGAGTIIATANNEKGISGINQSDNIKVMSVKALGGRSGAGSTASVIRAILYAEANGADICNLSLGTSKNDDALYQTIKNSNMLFVVAAGNDGINMDEQASYPASYDLDNIISVGNLNYDGTLHYSSNYGQKTVDIAAPGCYILSTTTNNGYSYMTGTSMSAPVVSGAAAMVYSHFKNATLADVKEILLSSATTLQPLEGIVKTGGMLNLGNALAFDTNNLSGVKWEEKTPYVYLGNAPEISAQIISDRKKSYLTVQFYDEDNDIALAAYAEGELEAKDFDKGKNGNIIKLSQTGVVTYGATEGTYTFYAIDANGNETAKVIKIVKNQNQQSQMPTGFPGYMSGFPSPYDFPGMGDTSPFINIWDEIFNILNQFR